MAYRCAAVAVSLVLPWLAAPACAQSDDEKARIAAALPAQAYAKPAQPRKLLIFSLTRGFRHSSIPIGAHALARMGEKSGAYSAVHSEDPAVFEAGALEAFDAVCFLSTTGELFTAPNLKDVPEAEKRAAQEREARLKKNLLDFVNNGKGFVGIHAATDTCYQWPEYGQMIGGYFDGHPWHEEVFVHVEEPAHPLNAAFGGKDFAITDEIYQLKDPYSRKRQQVLLALDVQKTNMQKEGVRRTDGDFAVSWARNQGQGRVFYCSLGHREEIYWNPTILSHYLAGIQWACGDLRWTPEQPAQAAGTTAGAGWSTLFNGRDLTGWKGLVADPPKRAKMSPAELADAQAKADESMRKHWRIEDGALVFDGRGESLCTARDFGDFELKVDWKIEAGGDSGIYLRGSPQVQIWDPAQWPEGSGGLYNNQKHPNKPLRRADKPIGEWNSFEIRMVGERVSVRLNGELVVDDVVLENYWERDKPIYASGQIELQSHGSKLYFRNIQIRELGRQP